jgi:PAS domain S-box-containing protein
VRAVSAPLPTPERGAGEIAVMNWLRAFLDTSFLSPHGICLLWRPELLWTQAVSDSLIGLAYFSIPLALGVFLNRRPDVRFNRAAWMFVAFIMLCGVTHFMGVWTLWRPDYGVEALIKAVTAVASLITAVALWPLLPRAIAMPSSAILEARVQERDAALQKLTAAMETMVAMEEHQAEQQRLLAEIQEKEARLRSVFDNAAVGIARVAPDGRFLEVNARYTEIAGWTEEEMLAGGLQRITHPDDFPRNLERMQALLRGELSRYAIDKRYVRRDGVVVWVNVTVSRALGASGAPDQIVAIAEDVTDEKRSEDARLLLMREVDHRARNALAVVQSIVRLTDGADPKRYKDVVTGRVDALARAQSSLSRSNWEGALINDVLREELGPAAAPEQIELSGPAHMLRPESVQPFGMLLHELTTNAAKYGALSTPQGRVSVAWGRTPEGGIELVWTERGGPPAPPPERTGFGSRLVSQLAAQLNATACFDWPAQGLVFRLTIRPPRAEISPAPSSEFSFIR